MSDDAIFLEVNADLDDAAREWRSVETLDEPVRDESVEEARKILRWLRNLQSTEMVVEEWLDIGTLVEQAAKAGPLAKLAKIFLRKLRKARKSRPNLLEEDNTVENAVHAAAALMQAVAEFFINRLTEDGTRATELESLIASLPPQAEMRQSQSVKRLLETLSLGFDRVLGRTVGDLTPASRLMEISSRLHLDAHGLRQAQDIEPEREESIGLARDLLRKLKNLSFGNVPLQKIIDAGTPEDKAAFAQKIDEITNIYRNLLAEAGQLNPNIFQDPLIKSANDSAGAFSHAVTLMAAKEMPGSIAAAQQISADATQTPEEWRDLHHRTVDRLVKSMEGGLEKAVGEIEAQQQQEDDLEQDSIDAALTQSDQKGRKKKRRKKRGGSKSGAGGKKQRKQMMDLTADDYVLKQGRFSEDAKVVRAAAAPMPGLSADALAAVRSLGGALQDIGRNMSAVSTGDKIVPDDKTAAQTHAEREKRGPQGPRV